MPETLKKEIKFLGGFMLGLISGATGAAVITMLALAFANIVWPP